MNIRLVASRVLVAMIVLVALVSQHAWAERGIVDTSLSAIGFVLLLTGCAGRIWCAMYISGRKNRELVTEGPFSMMRNPLYFFTLIALIGGGLAFESLELAGALTVVFFLTHWPTILSEERKLLQIFGKPYAAYMEQVPRFIPSIHLRLPARQVNLSTRALNRAVLEAAPIPLVYLGAQMCELAHEHHWLPTLLWVY